EKTFLDGRHSIDEHCSVTNNR
ncbi:LPXTG cell wall anchor domain-containing protein, partial [Enterococcus casseliflavus]|nr:LPXTG cell wall anchor domain-containing protein [Enterococcus casseliflavus]